MCGGKCPRVDQGGSVRGGMSRGGNVLHSILGYTKPNPNSRVGRAVGLLDRLTIRNNLLGLALDLLVVKGDIINNCLCRYFRW